MSSNDLLVSLSLEDYNWKVHGLLSNDKKAESALYKQSWRFVLLLQSIESYTEWCLEKGITLPSRLKKASSLISKVFGSPTPTLPEIIGNKILNLHQLRLPRLGANLDDFEVDSLELGGGEVLFDKVQSDRGLKQAISENIDHLTNIFGDALSSIEPDWPRVFIIFDRVDEAWDRDSYELSKKLIGGLVTASASITDDYKGKIRPIIFLREDIFEVLSINDANKLREDCGALLHWKKDTLSNMILRRVNYFAEKSGVPAVQDLNNLFDRKEMRQRSSPVQYIIRRSMMRPRDVIAFLGRIVVSMKENKDDPFGDGGCKFNSLECDSVYSAEAGYSDWLKKEIIDEWGTQRPEIIGLINAIQNNGSTNLSKIQLLDQMNKLGLSASTTEIISYLRFLFDNSIIGFKVGDSNEWKFRCFYPSQGFVESDEYRVHEGLSRALNLTEPRTRDAS